MITLLIADDHPLYRDALKGSLSLSLPALTLKEAGDLTTTVDILKQEDIDLLLLDLHMPGQVDGEELLFELRDRGDEVPIIVVSGWVDDETTVYHPDCVHAVLKKPIQKDHLVETIRLALGA